MSLLGGRVVREVNLPAVSSLARELCQRVESGAFRPDCVVYLETAGRLPAAECCAYFDVGAVPLRIQRKGGSWKGRLSVLLAVLPASVKNTLRRLEAMLVWKPMSSHRSLGEFPHVDLRGKRVLIIDDAVDTGASVQMARAWALEMGAAPEQVKVAALTVTTRMADGLVDFCVYREMCRFPWSSDSDELASYRTVYHQTRVPGYGQPAPARTQPRP